MSLASMLQGLTTDRIRFVVVGGVAAAAHGSTLVTNDLDLCYDTAEDNVTRLASRLAAWRAYPRGIDAGFPFFMDARTFRTTPLMTLQTSEGALDLLDRLEGLGTYADLLKMSDQVKALGTSFRVLGLPALIRAKRATRRPKDLAQLPELEALLALTDKSKRS